MWVSRARAGRGHACPPAVYRQTLWSLCVVPGNLKSVAEVDREQLDELIESEACDTSDVSPSCAVFVCSTSLASRCRWRDICDLGWSSVSSLPRGMHCDIL